jgi:hypothetical protein
VFRLFCFSAGVCSQLPRGHMLLGTLVVRRVTATCRGYESIQRCTAWVIGHSRTAAIGVVGQRIRPKVSLVNA